MTVENDWRSLAECRVGGHDPELWHPLTESGEHTTQIEQAKTVCRRCPVMDECRAEALLRPSTTYGVWGATTHEERRQIARSTRRGQRATAADHVVVERALAHRDAAIGMDDRDRLEAARRLQDQGLSACVIAAHLRMGTDTVVRVLGGDRA